VTPESRRRNIDLKTKPRRTCRTFPRSHEHTAVCRFRAADRQTVEMESRRSRKDPDPDSPSPHLDSDDVTFDFSSERSSSTTDRPTNDREEKGVHPPPSGTYGAGASSSNRRPGGAASARLCLRVSNDDDFWPRADRIGSDRTATPAASSVDESERSGVAEEGFLLVVSVSCWH
jgi:hypothetical protein